MRDFGAALSGTNSLSSEYPLAALRSICMCPQATQETGADTATSTMPAASGSTSCRTVGTNASTFRVTRRASATAERTVVMSTGMSTVGFGKTAATTAAMDMIAKAWERCFSGRYG